MSLELTADWFVRTLIRLRWVVVAAWVLAAAVLILSVPQADPLVSEQPSFLPETAPSRQATAALARHFPSRGGLSEAVVVFERGGGELGGRDWRAIEEIAHLLGRATHPLRQEELQDVIVRSPASLPLPKTPLISEDRQAALIVVGIPANFITLRSARVVEHVQRVVEGYKLPEGLGAAITGSSGFGRDYALAAKKSSDQTFYVTVAAVVVILLLVYRAPVAAFIPLAAIGLAAVVALKVLDLGGHVGLHVGTAERIFVVVLLFGAGTDYALLLMSRCHEFLDASFSPRASAAAGLQGTLGAILASAGTDVAGLLMLVFAQYGIFRTTGPAVAVALGVAMLASITLVPSAMAIAGGVLFWPGKRMGSFGQKRLWPAVGAAVTRRPVWVLVATLALLAGPAIQGLNIRWVYDTLAYLSDDYQAARGLNMAMRHWPVGEVAPLSVLVEADKPLSSQQWDRLAGRVTRRLAGVEGVRDIRSLTQPVGSLVGEVETLSATAPATGGRIRDPGSATAPASPALSLLPGLGPLPRLNGRPRPSLLDKLGIGDVVQRLKEIGREKIEQEYLSGDRRATRLVVILGKPSLTLEAMASVDQIRQAARAALRDAGADAQVHVAGITAEIMDTRSVTRSDFYLVAFLVLGTILLMIILLLRDWLLSLFMIASTVVSYLATLGLTYWFFAVVFGSPGLDWKVEVFLFVVMVAVGQDYNIFLAARLAQEARRHDAKEATRLAVIHTGPVISSCGVIMAATLGSLAAGDLVLLIQLGFSLALGMLIDTFIVRPLLLPAFVVLTGRTGKTL